MEAIGNKGDILILITTSGNSINLIETLKVAKKGLKIYCFSGNNGGKIKRYLKNMVIIPSKNTSLIQVVEIFLGQLSGYLEKNSKNEKKIY